MLHDKAANTDIRLWGFRVHSRVGHADTPSRVVMEAEGIC